MTKARALYFPFLAVLNIALWGWLHMRQVRLEELTMVQWEACQVQWAVCQNAHQHALRDLDDAITHTTELEHDVARLRRICLVEPQ